MRCHGCRETLIPGVAFCPHCGQPLGATSFVAPPPPGRLQPPLGTGLNLRTSTCTRTVALLLAVIPLFCFGVGGIHHFYTGRIAFGILQLLTVGGLFIWAICDVVRIASGDFRDVDDRPLARE